MKKALWKDSIREIRVSFARFISIFVIIFLGVAFFAGVKSTAPTMKHSVDLYYDEYDMMDISVYSTLGLTEDDITAIKNTDGVDRVQPGYFCDVVTTIDSTQHVYRVHSIPQSAINSEDKNHLNRIQITEGRYPEKSGECVIEESFFFELNLKIGEVIKLSSGKVEKITENTLKVDEFVVVGKAKTPYYLSYEKGTTDIGNGRLSYFMMVLEDDFIIPFYTEAQVTVKGAKALNSYSHDYTNLIERTSSPLENLGVERTELRIKDIRDEAYKQLDEAKGEYDEEKKKFDEEIGKAEEELDNAELELVEGQATLDTNKENFDTYHNEASKQIDAAEKDLEAAEKNYDEAEKEYNETMEEYGDDIDEMDERVNQINESRNEAQTAVDELYLRLEDPDLSEDERENIETIIVYYEEYIVTIDEDIETINNLNELSKTQVKNAEDQLANAREELDNSRIELDSAKSNLRRSKKDAEKDFEEGQKEIDDGWILYNDGVGELEKQREDGQLQLHEGLQKINDAEIEIEKLKKPQWYVLTRESHYSYVDFGKTADRMDAIAKIFPMFFFVVATLVCLTTMTRMVAEQRGNIGIHKALGYSNFAIVRKYVMYAAIASFFGGVGGLFVGINVFPRVIYNAWTMMYTLPPIEKQLGIILMVLSVLIGILVTTMAALISCSASLKETPSMLMRPKAPKAGKKVFLENINVIWKRLSFSQKVTMRNLFRYKKRFIMTILGIIGCTALLLAGFGLSNSISQVVDKQFKEIFTYDLNMRYSEFANDDEKIEVMGDLNSDERVESYLMGTVLNADVKFKSDDITTTLIVPKNLLNFKNFITLRKRTSQKPVELSNKGIVITEKLSKELKVKVGDIIEIKIGEGEEEQTKKVIISGVTENYVFHYVYMSPSYYEEIFLEAPEINDIMIRLKDANDETEKALGSALISKDAVSSLEYYSAAVDTFSDTVKILNSIVIVIIISAGLLAFVVLYNLTNINICERIREIATLKVLGFYSKEVSAYVYRENIILSMIGAIIGLFVGIVLHGFIMVSIEQDGIMFGNHIEPISFLYAFLITMGFVVLVNLIMYRRLKNIPMVESLKSVE